MPKEFRLQDPGEGIHEAEIVEINVAEGDQVQEGDNVLAVETDKATVDLPSPYGGSVQRIAVETGQRVSVGDLLMTLEGGEETGQEEASAREGATEAADAGQAEPADETREATAEEPPSEPSPGPIPAAPSTRRIARELGVDLRRVEPSGPGGRVLTEDVQAAAEAGGKAGQESAETRRPAPQSAPESPDFGQWGEIERIELRSIRRAVARQMARAWSEIPHVMHHDRVDITELERFRREHAPEIERQGGKLTLTVLVMKALVAALREFPRFNASLDAAGDGIILKHYCHIGVAVATERGLLVPVVRDIDRKSIAEIAVELAELAARTRRGEARREELQGGSFTLTNVGAIGGELFTPIIRHPEAAILGLARAGLQPVATGDAENPKIGARLILPLCLAFDHRLNDGADAARFVNRLAQNLQDPASLLLRAV